MLLGASPAAFSDARVARQRARSSSTASQIARYAPSFPKDLRNDVQIIFTALSHDQVHNMDILCMIGASAALTISDAPWDGPIGAVRVGLIDGELVINPTIPEMEDSELDLRMAGTADAITMVEAGASEVPEATMIEALRFGHEAMQPIIELQNQMRAEIGKPKAEYSPRAVDGSRARAE